MQLSPIVFLPIRTTVATTVATNSSFLVIQQTPATGVSGDELMTQPNDQRDVSPGPTQRVVRDPNGKLLDIPKGWALLAPGDAGLTRRVKSTGPSWTVKEKKGRRVFSRGVWAPAAQIEAAKQSVQADRENPAYAKRKATDAARREKKQQVYVEDFSAAVLEFLRFHADHRHLARKIAHAVTVHATPVGSGTVARTTRIPLERRAESAVIAWMRHQTTAYDHMTIERKKGRRREVRRELAAESRRLLANYRRGKKVDSETCPLKRAIRLASESSDL